MTRKRTTEESIARAAAKVDARKLPDLRGMVFDSIDPGTNYCGWAHWDGLSLIACGYATGLRPPRSTYRLVIESPVVYPHSRVDPNDIVALARSTGFLAGPYGFPHYVEPRQWKGTTDGALWLARIRAAVAERISDREVLDAALAKAKPKHHEHVIDAVGLGLACLGVKI